MTADRRFPRANFILGLEGLAILRGWWLDPKAAEARAKEMADILARMGEDEFLSISRDVPETDLLKGYAAWSETYDKLFNPVVEAEERGVKPLLDELNGVVADVGCGTGRHTKYLKDRGVIVIGLDQSHEMLAQAGSRDPDLRLCQADGAGPPVSRFGIRRGCVCSRVGPLRRTWARSRGDEARCAQPRKHRDLRHPPVCRRPRRSRRLLRLSREVRRDP